MIRDALKEEEMKSDGGRDDPRILKIAYCRAVLLRFAATRTVAIALRVALVAIHAVPFR